MRAQQNKSCVDVTSFPIGSLSALSNQFVRNLYCLHFDMIYMVVYEIAINCDVGFF
jgi:hypothetical protein